MHIQPHRYVPRPDIASIFLFLTLAFINPHTYIHPQTTAAAATCPNQSFTTTTTTTLTTPNAAGAEWRGEVRQVKPHHHRYTITATTERHHRHCALRL
ncbi:hypothetical protein E2C01_027397 [Portunus trituberculatus]|uniref:Uncharacterized protein n=1 Tax=Portunus trituberculatus TaxID=210409 RepID=A0A5B7ENM8_PORTR|nr:hypothetical protein [Portunus trituberculatus]